MSKETYNAPKLNMQPAEIFDLLSIVAFQSKGIGIIAKTMSVKVDIAACSKDSATVTLLLTHLFEYWCSVYFPGLPQRNMVKKI